MKKFGIYLYVGRGVSRFLIMIEAATAAEARSQACLALPEEHHGDIIAREWGRPT